MGLSDENIFSETKLISDAYCAHDIPGIIYIFGKKVIGTVAMAKLIIHPWVIRLYYK